MTVLDMSWEDRRVMEKEIAAMSEALALLEREKARADEQNNFAQSVQLTLRRERRNLEETLRSAKEENALLKR